MSKFLKYIESAQFLKFITGFTILGCFWVVIMSVVINPNSLNPQKNPIIDILIGALIFGVADLRAHYFTPKNNDKPESK